MRRRSRRHAHPGLALGRRSDGGAERRAALSADGVGAGRLRAAITSALVIRPPGPVGVDARATSTPLSAISLRTAGPERSSARRHPRRCRLSPLAGRGDARRGRLSLSPRAGRGTGGVRGRCGGSAVRNRAEHRADRHVAALGGAGSRRACRPRRRHLERHLVGFQFDDRLVASTRSPGCFSHFATVASVTDSPRLGTLDLGRHCAVSRRQRLGDELRLLLRRAA